MRLDLFERGRATALRRGVALLVDGPVGVLRREWLRQHLGAHAAARVIDVGARRDPGWSDDLEEVAAALGTAPRPFTCAPDEAARAVDDGDTLLVVLDDEGGRAATWARRSARGPTLLLPAHGPLLRPAGPRAALLARDPLELASLMPWARLLAPDVELALVGLVPAVADTPARVLADVRALEASLQGAAGVFAAEGRQATVELEVTSGLDDARAHERDTTLVLAVERRGLLRRLLPALTSRGRPRARLLVAP